VAICGGFATIPHFGEREVQPTAVYSRTLSPDCWTQSWQR
jgi:hypothetical protein